jgi:hypothetical protein
MHFCCQNVKMYTESSILNVVSYVQRAVVNDITLLLQTIENWNMKEHVTLLFLSLIDISYMHVWPWQYLSCRQVLYRYHFINEAVAQWFSNFFNFRTFFRFKYFLELNPFLRICVTKEVQKLCTHFFAEYLFQNVVHLFLNITLYS